MSHENESQQLQVHIEQQVTKILDSSNFGPLKGTPLQEQIDSGFQRETVTMPNNLVQKALDSCYQQVPELKSAIYRK